jgi:MFS family permease
MLGAVRAEPHPGRATPAVASPLADDNLEPDVDTCPIEEIEDALVDGDRAFAPGSARAALSHPVFRRVFAGSFLSNIGSWMQNVVLGALAYDLTHSATFVGVILFAQLGPLLLLSMVGGALADTFDRRRLLVTVSISQLALAFVLAGVAAPDDPNLVALVAVVFAIGVGQAFFNPAYAAMLPQLVGRADLPGAIALHSASMNGSRVVGPAIGGVLFAALGAPAVFAVNGLSYLFVVASLLTVHLPPPEARPDEVRGLRRLGAGLAIAREDRVVGRCLVTVFVFSLVSLTFVGQFPVVAEVNLGIAGDSGAYGLLFGCLGIGAVVGAMSIGTVFSQRSKKAIVPRSLVAYAVALSVFALVRSPGLAYPVVLVVGLAYFAFITSLSTVLQTDLPDHQRGAVMALWIMGFGGTVPIGNLIAGPIIEATSITAVMLVGAACALGLSFYARFDRDRDGEPARPRVAERI